MYNFNSKFLATDVALLDALTNPSRFPFGNGKLDKIDNMFTDIFGTISSLQPYPPSNTIKTENGYLIEMALAGFGKEDIDVSQTDNTLTIATKKQESVAEENKETDYVYRGISSRSFSRKYLLDKELEVTDVSLNNGLLSVTITKRPQPESKVKTFKIK